MLLKISALVFALTLTGQFPGRDIQPPPAQQPFLKREGSSRVLYSRILEAEDRRTLSKELIEMLDRTHTGVRRRAAAAIGRIGDPVGINALVERYEVERSDKVRAEIVFALGEIEDARALTFLLERVADAKSPTLVQGLAVEAIGKIGAANSATLGAPRLESLSATVAAELPPASQEVKGEDAEAASLAVTALLRLKQPSAVPVLIAQLRSRNADLRWQAANALARIRPDAALAAPAVEPLLDLLKARTPDERAHAARALGVVGGERAVAPLLPLLSDPDPRVQANAIRALGGLGDKRAAGALGSLGERLLEAYRAHREAGDPGVPEEHGLLMLTAEALGQLADPASLPLLARIRALDGHAGANPETEIAVAKFGEEAFFDIPEAAAVPAEWPAIAAYAQGLRALEGDRARQELLDILGGRRFGAVDARALPDVLTALSGLAPMGLEQILIDALSHPDFVVRATAATQLGERFAPSQSEATFRALDAALKASADDRETDARLAIVDAIAKYTRPRALELLSGLLVEREDYIVRRRAAELLEAARAGSFRSKVGPVVVPGRTRGFYERVEAAMRGPSPKAVITTEKGDVEIELLIHDAPLTVQNFISLARSNYFANIAFHRIVPNFVVQGGDPRGDGNGGPGYHIRCEINRVPYERGAVGMALSGKDTGGSQFFITHAPQPHLDGGYTVFGRVIDGMEVVDRLSRGDRILGVTILER